MKWKEVFGILTASITILGVAGTAYPKIRGLATTTELEAVQTNLSLHTNQYSHEGIERDVQMIIRGLNELRCSEQARIQRKPIEDQASCFLTPNSSTRIGR